MTHRHLPFEEICEMVSEAQPQDRLEGCEICEAEASSVSDLFKELRRADAETAPATEWDSLVLRSRIREAVARERPHAGSVFDRFAILRPAFVSALVAVLAFTIWIPRSLENGGSAGVPLAAASRATGANGHLPAWTPLPDESEDEGLAILAEWTPSEEELDIARCRAACLGGLGAEEEELLRAAVATPAPNPVTGASPL